MLHRIQLKSVDALGLKTTSTKQKEKKRKTPPTIAERIGPLFVCDRWLFVEGAELCIE